MLLDKDALLAAINALPDATPADVGSLQQQVSDLQAKLDAANKAVSDEQAQIQADQVAEKGLQGQLDSANAVIAAVKAALGLAPSPTSAS